MLTRWHFLAVFGIINWILLGWSNGSFPATELMFGFLAYFALSEEPQQRRSCRVGPRRAAALDSV